MIILPTHASNHVLKVIPAYDPRFWRCGERHQPLERVTTARIALFQTVKSMRCTVRINHGCRQNGVFKIRMEAVRGKRER